MSFFSCIISFIGAILALDSGGDKILSSILYFIFGGAVGIYGTMIGAGGGFIIVPLLLLFKTPHEVAVGTSLTIVFLNALSGSISYARQKLIDWRAAIVFSCAAVPGAIIGVHFTRMLSGKNFQIIFAVLLLLLSSYLIFNPDKKRKSHPHEVHHHKGKFYVWRTQHTAHGDVYHYSYNELLGTVFSFFVGILSSLLGIGGGIIHVPALIQLFTFPAHVATATSHMILAVSALAGAAEHWRANTVLWREAALMGGGVVIGAQIGAILAKRVHGTVLIRLLAGALFIVGIRLLLTT